MALYAFDGTWNLDEDDDEKDTNVVRFKELYGGPTEYRAGCGTRLRALGRVMGGVFGFGGHKRIKEMYQELEENWALGDQVVDIIGFSRGAALAVHFANKIADEGISLADGSTARPDIRFLGVWDLVASFGLSFDTLVDFQEINLGWDIAKVADNVRHCFHAMALDERRETFRVTRLNSDHRLDNVTEVWFRGVHSDIGGGNENPGRSNIALGWMLDRARDCGLPIKEGRSRGDKYFKIDVLAPISENEDPQRDERRPLLPGDEVHSTARAVDLVLGDVHTVRVFSKLRYNWSGIRVKEGGEYRISVPDGQTWQDKDIVCGPAGWRSEELPWYSEQVVRVFERRRRVPGADWFQLCGALGDEDDNVFALDVGSADYRAMSDGEFYLFANDLPSKYDNNVGFLDVTIERVA